MVIPVKQFTARAKEFPEDIFLINCDLITNAWYSDSNISAINDCGEGGDMSCIAVGSCVGRSTFDRRRCLFRLERRCRNALSFYRRCGAHGSPLVLIIALRVIAKVRSCGIWRRWCCCGFGIGWHPVGPQAFMLSGSSWSLHLYIKLTRAFQLVLRYNRIGFDYCRRQADSANMFGTLTGEEFRSRRDLDYLAQHLELWGGTLGHIPSSSLLSGLSAPGRLYRGHFVDVRCSTSFDEYGIDYYGWFRLLGLAAVLVWVARDNCWDDIRIQAITDITRAVRAYIWTMIIIDHR